MTRTKALVTLGAGDHAQLLELTLPSMCRFAERHGYDVLVGTGAESRGRPPAWAKVPLLQRALARFDYALWLDADALVVRDDVDVVDELPPSAFQALAEHQTGQGRCPNTGVWLLRAGPDSKAFLEAVWGSAAYVDHPWWENAAVCDLLGYQAGPPCELAHLSPFGRSTHWLPIIWNSIPGVPVERPRIVHLAGEPLDTRRERLRDELESSCRTRIEPLVSSALARMDSIEGWLAEDEAETLLRAAGRALLTRASGPGTIVEVGSMWGRSTVVLATAAQALTPAAYVHAVDPHEGEVSTLGGGVSHHAPTYAQFLANLERVGVTDAVKPHKSRSCETPWGEEIDLLFIDSLHEYADVQRDFRHFAPWLRSGGLVAFHDYAAHFPGVKQFVDELLSEPGFSSVDAAGSLIVLCCDRPECSRASRDSST